MQNRRRRLILRDLKLAARPRDRTPPLDNFASVANFSHFTYLSPNSKRRLYT